MIFDIFFFFAGNASNWAQKKGIKEKCLKKNTKEICEKF